jgi:hypothetical protein
MTKYFLVPLIVGALTGCSSKKQQTDADVKNEIQQQLDKCVQAVSTKNIDLYMDMIPEDFVIKDNSGETISREQQKEYTLRDWAIIDATLSNKFVVDSLFRYNDSAIVYTAQEWKRLMFQRDGKTKDTVLTTQRHREIWKKTPKGWLNYEVAELGGAIYINGKPYIDSNDSKTLKN